MSIRSRAVTKRLTPPVSRASSARNLSWLALPMPRQCSRTPAERASARIFSVAGHLPVGEDQDIAPSAPEQFRRFEKASGQLGASTRVHSCEELVGLIAQFPRAGDKRRLKVQYLVVERDKTEGVCLGKHSQAGLNRFAGLRHGLALHGPRPVEQNHHTPRRFRVAPKLDDGTIAAKRQLPSLPRPAST